MTNETDRTQYTESAAIVDAQTIEDRELAFAGKMRIFYDGAGGKAVKKLNETRINPYEARK